MKKHLFERFIELWHLIDKKVLIKVNDTQFIYKGKNYYVLNGKLESQEGTPLVINGNYAFLEHIDFVKDYPPPYNPVNLAHHWFFKTLPFKRRNFWTKEQICECFKILILNGERFNSNHVFTNYPDLYAAIQREKDFHPIGDELTTPFRKLLSYLDIESNDVYLRNRLLEEGKYCERQIKLILYKYVKKDIFNFKPCIDGFFPDLFNEVTNELIDLKRSVRTPINKEKEKYTLYGSVVVVYLFGSIEHNYEEDSVKKLHINGWIEHNKKFFTDVELLINEINHFLQTSDPEEFEKSQNEYYLKLVQDVFALNDKNFTQVQIAEELGYSRRYIGKILNGKRLNQFSDEFVKKYKYQKEEVQKIMSERNLDIFDLCEKGYTYEQIVEELSGKYGEQITVTVIKDLMQRTKKKNSEKSGRFIMFSSEGEFINRFQTITQCAMEYKELCPKVIFKCLQDLTNSYHHYILIYEKNLSENPHLLEEKIIKIRNSNRGKPFIIKKRMSGVIVGVYTNQRVAAEEINMCYKKFNAILCGKYNNENFIIEPVKN